jgi:hypothetical protein
MKYPGAKHGALGSTMIAMGLSVPRIASPSTLSPSDRERYILFSSRAAVSGATSMMQPCVTTLCSSRVALYSRQGHNLQQ